MNNIFEKKEKKERVLTNSILINFKENSFLYDDEVNTLLKNNIFYSIIYKDGNKCYIFDLTKDSIKPILNDLNSYSPKNQLDKTTLIFIGIALIGGYFIFNKDKIDVPLVDEVVKTVSTGSLLQIKEEINLEKSIINELVINHVNQFDILSSNSQIDDLNLLLQKNSYELDSCLIYNEKITKDNSELINNYNSLDNDYRLLFSENNNLTETYNNLKNSTNSLNSFIGEKVLKLCEENDFGKCKDLIFNYYNK